jgi:hypothetical protein
LDTTPFWPIISAVALAPPIATGCVKQYKEVRNIKNLGV